MCGRFANASNPDQLKASFRVQFPAVNPPQTGAGEGAASGHNLAPRWNIAPGTMIDTITGDEDRSMTPAHWGLVNPKSPRPLINARGETMLEKPTFADAARHRRCVVVATGWYEWKAPRQPYYIRRRDGAPMAMAGLYRLNADHQPAERSAVIVTRSAVAGLGEVHHRAPLLLGPESLNRWLDPSCPEAVIEAMVLPEDGGDLEWYPVSAEVGSVRADHEGLMQRDDSHGQAPPAQMELF